VKMSPPVLEEPPTLQLGHGSGEGRTMIERSPGTVPVDEVLDALTGLAAQACGAELAALLLRDDGDDWRLCSVSGMAAGELLAVAPFLGLGRSPLLGGELVLRIADLREDPRARWNLPAGVGAAGPAIASYCSATAHQPAAGRSVALAVGHAEPGRFGDGHGRLVQSLAGRAARLLELAGPPRRAADAAGARDAAGGDGGDLPQELLATLGHELRSPLGSMCTALDLLQHEDADDSMRGQLLAMLRRQVDHLGRLVQDLIESAQTRRHELVVRWEPVELAALVREVVEGQRPEIANGGRRLQLVPADEPVWVMGDPVRLSQVVRNLLGNAQKFTDGDGCIEVAVVRRDDRAEVRVTDDGCGIAPEKLETVFEPFERGGAPRPDDGGLGLGLTIVRRLVEAHGGRVTAASDGDGHGTTLTVVLPVQQVE
jgi:signal transduction histidine kinase